MSKKESHEQRIESVLNQAFNHSVVLIEAAPGYGKSEQVQSFLEKKSRKYAWLRLRGMDNHLFFNWSQLIKAFSKIMPRQVNEFAKLETPTTLGQIAELIELIDRTPARTVRRVLVLDDYSVLHDETVQFLYENLIENNFSNLCIVIISSQKSAIRNICSRSHTDYFYINEEHLRFTEAETYSLFKENGIVLSPAQVVEVNEKWRGWPLPLLVLAKDCRRPREVMSNSLDKIQELFYSQFFFEYSIEQKKCLIQLSVLEEIPSELFGSLNKENNILEKHPFLFYDYKNDTYSFQKVYNEFLKERYPILSEAEKQTFYRLAAEAFLKRNKIEEALALFSYGLQYDRVVELIWKLITPFIEYSRAQFLYSYSEKLPREYLDQHPHAEFQKLFLLFYIERVDEMERSLHSIIERYESEKCSDRNVLGNAYHLLAQIDRMNANEIFLEHTRLASLYLPKGSQYPVPMVLKAPWTRFPSYEKESPYQIEHAKEVFNTLNQYITIIMGGIDTHEDKFCEAEIAYYQFDFKTARIKLLEILHMAEANQLYESILLIYHYLMRIELLKGDVPAAQHHLKTVTRMIEEQSLYQYNGFQARMASWIALYLHKPNEVPTRIIKNDIRNGAKWELARNGFPQAKYLIQTNRYEDAIALLNYLENYYSEFKGFWMSTLNIKVFRAIAYLRIGEKSDAINDLEAAYHMSYGNKIITQFIEWDEDMRHMIQVVRKEAPERFDREWCDIVYAKSTTLAKRISKIRRQQIVEERTPQLTPRRLEILNDLAQGLTSEEIAEERHISVNTVHSHIKNIYSDLGAINRADAIRIATQNNII